MYGPDGIHTGEMVQYLLDERAIKISGGLGESLRERVFRVGHMSPGVSEKDIDDMIEGLTAFLAAK